ncbi:MAG: hypothetical protein E7Z99_07615 [Coriobacteriaceae bacterium]|nr:hypothetical protein [Coriobacteriaceae bacterium]
MIKINSAYIGNEGESYIQDGFTDGLNIITSKDNHVGKTIVMQSIMYALGADAMFPANFEYRQYLFIVDIDIDGHELSILRNKDLFVVKDADSIIPLEGKGAFDEYWSEHISPLPSIVKKGVPVRVGLPLYTQMAFVSQAGRNTSRVMGGYFDRNDFAEMVFAIVGLDARQMDSRAEADLKRRRDKLRTRRKELEKQVSMLRKPGTALALTSPTADREETVRYVAELDALKNELTDLNKRRNHAYTRMKKNESVLSELRSLNNEVKAGSVVCLECGSERIGYKVPGSDFVFDITTDDMRRQILRTVQDRIDAYAAEVRELEADIREVQRKFNAMADLRDLSLEDVFAAREGYVDIEAIDQELSGIADEIEDITEQLNEASRVSDEIREGRSDFKAKVLATMNRVRRTINNDPDAAEYADLFTPATRPYMGSEATEYYLARVYSLAKHVGYGLPILIDSFRAEELSSTREENALPLFVELPNQVIFTATLKEEEAGKYVENDGVNNIDYAGYIVNKLLSEADNESFSAKVASFGIRLDGGKNA